MLNEQMPVDTSAHNRRTLVLVVAILVLAATVGVAIGAAIARKDATPQLTSATSSPTASAADAVGDPHGAKACQLNQDAYDQGQLGDDAVILRISREAGQSPSSDIRFAAQMLQDRQAATRGGDAADLLNLTTASIKMQTACVRAGLN